MRERAPRWTGLAALVAGTGLFTLAAGGAGSVAHAGAAATQEDPGVTVLCRMDDGVLPEISGLTWSTRHPGIVWAHDDSGGGPSLFALDVADCRVRATLTLSGTEARDLEAVATGVDASGRPVLWVGDVGDNIDGWPSVRISAVPEPRRLADATVAVTTYEFTYADRPHDAETLLADPAGERLWAVTKQLAMGGLYRLPSPLRTGEVMQARRVADAGALVTDGAVAPDGSRYVLRDYLDARVFDGLPPGAEIARVELPAQPQGEAVTWAEDGRALVVASERDNRLLRVELPREAWTATAQAGASEASGSQSPPAPSGEPATTGASSSSEAPPTPGPTAWLAAAALVLSAGVLVAWVRARHRR